ncbi:MAG: hypothetical protein JXJ04_12435 [Spirochaetales bacterium]|nr:hypothetical protein [Spirochaetales bacterium]
MYKKLFKLAGICLLLIFVQSTLLAEKRCAINYPNRFLLTHKLKRIKNVDIIKTETTEKWTQMEIELRDEQYPLTINLLIGHKRFPKKMMFMVAPSGQNFRSTFFSPIDRNMALYLLEKGYLVVGVTYREDKLPIEDVGQFLTDWGMEKHTADLRKAVKLIQRIIKLPYDMIGQASSAVSIMDYASHYSGKLDKIILLDTDSFDPSLQPEKVVYADMTYNALNQIIASGMYANPFIDSLRNMIFAGTMYPDADSGQARDFLGLPGNFTYAGLLHFSLIYTAFLPGLHTPITGLPGEWVMIQGVTAGYYNYALDPLSDSYGFTYTSLGDLVQVGMNIGTGIIPIAYNRDIYALQSLNGAYEIDWSGIEERVIMINSEYSSGNQAYYGTLIQLAGNNDVSLNLIQGYAYIDLLLSPYAAYDVWPFILQD